VSYRKKKGYKEERNRKGKEEKRFLLGSEQYLVTLVRHCKVTGPKSGTALNMDTPERTADIFCFDHKTHQVCVQTCERIKITGSAVVITDNE
jgi:hypothetical protein